MEERSRIVIPTGGGPAEMLEAPHFDKEAKLAARPVVPLTEGPAPAAAADSADGPGAPAPRRYSLLALVIVAAASAGLAGGLAVGLYNSSQKAAAANAPAAILAPAPSSTAEMVVEKAAAAEEIAEGGDEARPVVAIVPASDAKDGEKAATERSAAGGPISVAPEKSRENSGRPDREGAKAVARESASERSEKVERSDENSKPSAEERRRRRDERDHDDISEVRARRRERRVGSEPAADFPPARRNRRVDQELNRIREIFEGSQP